MDNKEDHPGMPGVVDRMRTALGVSSDAGLAKFLGVSKTTLSSWRHRSTTPYGKCIEFAARMGLNLQWLINGVGEPWPDAQKSQATIDIDLLALALENYEKYWAPEFPNHPFQSRAHVTANAYLQYERLVSEAVATGKLDRESAIALIRSSFLASPSPVEGASAPLELFRTIG